MLELMFKVGIKQNNVSTVIWQHNEELVFVVSGTTNMYPGYGIVYKNVPVFWSLPEYLPCVYCSVTYNENSQFANVIWRNVPIDTGFRLIL